jgi:transcriptional regulator with XRE-family HTH domain
VPHSPSSSAQAARERVAQRLRDLRADAGITGSELAELCGWTHPKTSRPRLLGIPDDSAETAAARVERSKVIHEPGHRFVLLIEEGVLRYQLGDADAMAAQLGHLLTAGALPSVSLGIIPDSTPERALWPQELFHVYDDTLVSVELLSARVRVTQPSEIALYLKAFEQLRSMAVYGADARALIVKAIDALR